MGERPSILGLDSPAWQLMVSLHWTVWPKEHFIKCTHHNNVPRNLFLCKRIIPLCKHATLFSTVYTSCDWLLSWEQEVGRLEGRRRGSAHWLENGSHTNLLCPVFCHLEKWDPIALSEAACHQWAPGPWSGKTSLPTAATWVVEGTGPGTLTAPPDTCEALNSFTLLASIE